MNVNVPLALCENMSLDNLFTLVRRDPDTDTRYRGIVLSIQDDEKRIVRDWSRRERPSLVLSEQRLSKTASFLFSRFYCFRQFFRLELHLLFSLRRSRQIQRSTRRQKRRRRRDADDAGY